MCGDKNANHFKLTPEARRTMNPFIQPKRDDVTFAAVPAIKKKESAKSAVHSVLR